MADVTSGIFLLVRIMFWGLAVLSLRKGRPGVIAYLCLVHLNVFSYTAQSVNAVSFENLVKVFMLPLFMLWRDRPLPKVPKDWKKASWLWMAVTVYACVATAWSTYPLAGLKMTAYLISYALLFLVFLRHWRSGSLNRQVILISLWSGLALAIVQSYILPNPFGLGDELDFAARFTSFCSPQSFGLFLVVHAAFLLCYADRDRMFWVSIVASSVGVLMTGSRYAFLGMAVLLLGSFVFSKEGRVTHPALGRLPGKQVALGAATILLMIGLARTLPGNRLQELLGSPSSSVQSYEELGTVAFRFAVYEDAWERIQEFSHATALFGKGTSTSADVKIDILPTFNEDTVDANRSMHNEFLRALYEWGVTGLVLLSGFFFTITWRIWRVGLSGNGGKLIPLVALLPSLWLSMLVENTLSNPGEPAGTSIALILAFVAAVDWRKPPLSAEIGGQR